MPDPSEVDVAIVGGGVAGLSLARAAARAWLRVVLFDRARAVGAERPADAGASALPVALLNPWRGRKGAAHPDDLRGLAVLRRWREELEEDGPSGAHLGGVLRIPTSPRQARDWRARVQERSPSDARGAAEDGHGHARGRPGAVRADATNLAWLEAERVPSAYRAPHGALWVGDGGWVEPRRWLAALSGSARAQGASVREGTDVAHVEAALGVGWRLLDADGDVLVQAERVVLCIGADAAPALVSGDGTVAVPDPIRTRGEVVTLAGVPALPHPVAGGIYGASHPDGRTDAGPDLVSIGGGHRSADEDDPTAADRLQAAFAHLVPGVAEGARVDLWSGVRAKRPDARPWVAELAPGAWWFGAFAGRGFLCSADLAERLVTAWTDDSSP